VYEVAIADEELIVEERLSRADDVDMDPVVFKLTHPEQGEASLSLARADQDVELYRCFLKLCVLYPGRTIVPTREIDHVWHTHLLDTAKYRDDCERIFGQFLDHFPYAGLRGEDDRRAWRDDFAQTQALFKEHFDVEIGTEPAASVCNNHGNGSECCVGCIKPHSVVRRPRPSRSMIVT
jgi:hypothetical protein